MKNLSMHILDIVHNSITAKSTNISVTIEENTIANTITLEITDNGKGMDEETIEMVTDPFVTSRKNRKVGLGLPLLKQNAELCNGSLEIFSEISKGTSVKAVFQRDHIDMMPFGDISGTIVGLLAGTQGVEYKFSYRFNSEEYIFDSVEIREALDGVSLQSSEIRTYLKEMIDENIKEITSV